VQICESPSHRIAGERIARSGDHTASWSVELPRRRTHEKIATSLAARGLDDFSINENRVAQDGESRRDERRDYLRQRESRETPRDLWRGIAIAVEKGVFRDKASLCFVSPWSSRIVAPLQRDNTCTRAARWMRWPMDGVISCAKLVPRSFAANANSVKSRTAFAGVSNEMNRISSRVLESRDCPPASCLSVSI